MVGLQDDDGSDRPQVQQEQRGSLVQEGIWVIDLSVDDPTATKDGGDTYMVSAALVKAAVPCTFFACLWTAKAARIFHIGGHLGRSPTVDISEPLQDSAKGHMLRSRVILRMHCWCQYIPGYPALDAEQAETQGLAAPKEAKDEMHTWSAQHCHNVRGRKICVCGCR